MPRKNINFELDFMKKDIFPRFTVKQFDDVSFDIKPKNQGLDYDTTGMTGKIFVGVNNDMFMQTTGITVSSNNIKVLLDKNMLQNRGRAYAEIELTDSHGTITSSSFIFNIDEKIGEGAKIPGGYEGFVAKYERLISEFKAQVNSTINNCNTNVNSAIKQCNTNVDNKLNTVDSLINVKISDFEKRFNRLTSSQQQDAEVIDARDGETSLKARLDRDIEKVKQVYVELDGLQEQVSNIDSQLEHKVNVNEVFLKKNGININDFDETTRQTFLEQQGIDVNYILGDKNVNPNNTTFFVNGKNLVNKSKVKQGYYVNESTGVLTSNPAHCATDYMYIESNTQYVINKGGRVAFYNSNKEYISGSVDYNANRVITTPENAKYIVCSLTPASDINDLQVEKGSVATEYEEYKEYIPSKLLELPNMNNYVKNVFSNIGYENPMCVTYASGDLTRISAKPASKDGLLNNVSFRLASSNTVKIMLFSKEGNTFKFENEITLNAKKDYTTYYRGVDFGDIIVKEGWYIGIYASSNTIPIQTSSTINSYYFTEYMNTTTSSFYSANYDICLYAEIEENIFDKLETLEEKLENIESQEKTNILFRETFRNSIPSNFANNGRFTASNGLSSTSYGYDKQIYFNKKSTLESSIVRAKVKINSSDCKIAIGRRSSINSGSTICELDVANNKILMREAWNNDINMIPNVLLEKTFNVTLGREYVLEIERKTIADATFRIIDTITNEKVELVNEFKTTRKSCVGWDYPMIISLGGDYKITLFEYTSTQPVQSKLAIYGDSFIEGYSLVTDGLENRYAYKIKEILNGDCMICGRGGETSSGLIDKLETDFYKFSPKFTLLAIGTNDSDFNVWKTNIELLINKCIKNKSIPILATLSVRGDIDKSTFINQVNDYIRNSNYMYVDINLITSKNNDCITFDETLFYSDKMHPNVAGHDKIFKRFLLDCPEVFDLK